MHKLATFFAIISIEFQVPNYQFQIGVLTAMVVTTLSAMIFACYRSFGVPKTIMLAFMLGMGSFFLGSRQTDKNQFPYVVAGIICFAFVLILGANIR